MESLLSLLNPYRRLLLVELSPKISTIEISEAYSILTGPFFSTAPQIQY